MLGVIARAMDKGEQKEEDKKKCIVVRIFLLFIIYSNLSVK